METKKFKTYNRREGVKFLMHIRREGQQFCQWEYEPECFIIWSNGILSKMVRDKQYIYYLNKKWVETN